MVVLVMGGVGYIGSYMVWVLIDVGEDVVVIDCFLIGYCWVIVFEVKFYEGDIVDIVVFDCIVVENRIDVIIYFVGFIVVLELVVDLFGYYENNIVKLCVLIVWVVKMGVKYFVFLFMVVVYGMLDGFDLVFEIV